MLQIMKSSDIQYFEPCVNQLFFLSILSIPRASYWASIWSICSKIIFWLRKHENKLFLAYTASQKHESTLLHTYVLKELLTADC